MASDQAFVDFVEGQIDSSWGVSSRKMFGEYALFAGGKVVALICDNQLFVKPTDAGRAFIGKVTEAPPYPGAKPSLLIGARIEDRELLSELIRTTERAHPAPKPKGKRKGKPVKKSAVRRRGPA